MRRRSSTSADNLSVPPKDYYAVLGVPRDATEETIRSAYRKLARQYHPDVSTETGAPDRFKEVTEAYEILSDAERRQRYEMFGTGDGVAGFGSDDLINTFFGGDMRRRDRGPSRGADLRLALEIELIDTVRGAEKETLVPALSTCATGSGRGEVRQVQQSVFGRFVNVSTCPRCGGSGRSIDRPCSTCRGEGRERTERRVSLVVPPGIDDGQQLRVQGQGEAGTRGGPHGDLYVLVRVKEHRAFRRDGDDLLHILRISPAQAALGDEASVPTIEGDQAKVRIPAGSQHGQLVRIRGKGVPRLGASGRGDQLVYLEVVVPRSLSKEEKKLYQRLREVSGVPGQDDEGGVFDRIKEVFAND